MPDQSVVRETRTPGGFLTHGEEGWSPKDELRPIRYFQPTRPYPNLLIIAVAGKPAPLTLRWFSLWVPGTYPTRGRKSLAVGVYVTGAEGVMASCKLLWRESETTVGV